MTCFFCKGNMKEAKTIYTAEYNDNCILIVKHVPCMKCIQCGEVWYNGEVAEQLENIMYSLKNTLTEIAVVNFDEKVA